MAQLIERWTQSLKTPVRVAPALDVALPVGIVGGLWLRPPEGQVKPVVWVDRVLVVGLRKTLDLDFAGQQVLCDRTVEVGVAGAAGYA